MNTKTLTLSLLSAVTLLPVGAFAKDKHKESYAEHQAQLEADRRANGYYNPVPCAPPVVYDTCRPDYRACYYGPNDYDRHEYRDYRPSGLYIRIR